MANGLSGSSQDHTFPFEFTYLSSRGGRVIDVILPNTDDFLEDEGIPRSGVTYRLSADYCHYYYYHHHHTYYYCLYHSHAEY
jgi:hypothetical protein